VYHLELRQFPHNFCRFNLTEPELHETVLDGWVRGEWIEIGERRWNFHQAHLKVLEGPELPVEQLSMGRGWRNAVRQGSDVTEQLLASARTRATAPGARTIEPGVGPVPAAVFEPGAASEPATVSGLATASDAIERKLMIDSLARELLGLLGNDPGPLLRAWQLALERHPDRTPSECLALAEDLVRR
jgi:hypothetical protein